MHCLGCEEALEALGEGPRSTRSTKSSHAGHSGAVELRALPSGGPAWTTSSQHADHFLVDGARALPAPRWQMWPVWQQQGKTTCSIRVDHPVHASDQHQEGSSLSHLNGQMPRDSAFSQVRFRSEIRTECSSETTVRRSGRGCRHCSSRSGAGQQRPRGGDPPPPPAAASSPHSTTWTTASCRRVPHLAALHAPFHSGPGHLLPRHIGCTPLGGPTSFICPSHFSTGTCTRPRKFVLSVSSQAVCC